MGGVGKEGIEAPSKGSKGWGRSSGHLFMSIIVSGAAFYLHKSLIFAKISRSEPFFALLCLLFVLNRRTPPRVQLPEKEAQAFLFAGDD